MTRYSPQRGFTILELLTVVAIIGLIAAATLSSLTSARGKARDAAIISDMKQLANLMALDYADARTYAGLNGTNNYGWNYTAAHCNADFSGAYAENARQLCAHIIQTNGGVGFFSGVNAAAPYNFTTQNYFSFMAYLPGSNTWYCIGSRGVSATTPQPVDNWLRAGCYSNP
jgi:prepilin-type N-terminal cleavage/methylation domain-containing protein